MGKPFLLSNFLPAILMLVGTGLAYYVTRRCLGRSLTHTFRPENVKEASVQEKDEEGKDDIPANVFICTTCCEGKRPDAKESNKIPTGPELFRAIVNRLVPETASVDIEHTYVAITPKGARLRLIPQRCLSACRQSNCVALSHPYKYQYHFGQLEVACAQDVEDLVSFATRYAEEPSDAYTKKAERPGKLATGCISRLPPPLILGRDWA